MAETETMNAKAAETDEGDPLLGVSRETALELMKDMLLYRRFEEKAEEAYAIGKIGGFCHLHIGQEGVAAGSIAPMRDDDYVISAYREHTQALAKGVAPRAVMAELFGRQDGCSAGKGGSMHIFDASKGFMGGHGIVGAQVPLATGLAWAVKYRGENRVVLCFIGDAAVNQGAFHEAMNMAAVWDLPVILAVENNEYGMGTAFRRVSRTEIKDKACAYGIPSSVVNGQNVLETYTHFRDLAEAVRNGGGPRYVDVQTYRFKGHSMSDPVAGTYRSKEEVEGRVREADPIGVLRETLFELGALDQEGLEAMDREARELAQDAFDFADASPLPDPASLYTDVYAELNPHGRLFFDGRERPEGDR
jgi:pyruvate dehydrogenase E1 component alpha subunit